MMCSKANEQQLPLGIKFITLTEALQQLEHTGGQLVHIYAVVRDRTPAHKSGGSDYTCNVYLEDPMSKEALKVEMVCFARDVNSLPADPEGCLEPMKAKPGDIIRLVSVRIQWFGSEDKKKPQKPQILLQVQCKQTKKYRQGKWTLFSSHPPLEGDPEIPFASSSAEESHRNYQGPELELICSLRTAARERLDQAAAQQQQQQQQQQEQQQQDQVPLPPPPQQQQQQQQEFAFVDPSQPTELTKLEGLLGSCKAQERSLVEVICKVLAIDYRDSEYTVLYVWDATDTLPCPPLDILPCVANLDAAAGCWPLWKRQLHAMPLSSMPPPGAGIGSATNTGGCGAPPSWKGGADVVPPWQMPRLGTAVPVVVPRSVTAPPLLCCDRGVPISAGMEVKLKKVSPCIVQGQAQLLITNCSRCTIRESAEVVGGGGQEKAGQKRRQQQQQQQGNKKARIAKLGLADVYQSRKVQQRQEWEQLDLHQQQQRRRQQQQQQQQQQPQQQQHPQQHDESHLEDEPNGRDGHLATRVLLPPGYSGLPPRRGTVRDVLMAFMDAERDTKTPADATAATGDGAALQGCFEVPAFVVVARISAHYPHASQAAALLRSEVPDPGLPEKEWGHGSRAHLFKIIIEDATGQLDASVVGADVETFFGPLIPCQKWASDEPGDVQIRTGLMESGFRWLDSGIPSAHIGVSSSEGADIDHSRLGKQRGGRKGSSGSRGTARGGRAGSGNSSSSSRVPSGAVSEEGPRQPWCEVLIHPFVWDERVQGMQFHRVCHTSLNPAHLTARLDLA